MRTNFYIDAFNLYYGSLNNTSFKWLNLNEFCRQSFPSSPGRRESVELKKAATKAIRLDPAILATCQLPPIIKDAAGTIHKPTSW
jgi:hypothetical protein